MQLLLTSESGLSRTQMRSALQIVVFEGKPTVFYKTYLFLYLTEHKDNVLKINYLLS